MAQALSANSGLAALAAQSLSRPGHYWAKLLRLRAKANQKYARFKIKHVEGGVALDLICNLKPQRTAYPLNIGSRSEFEGLATIGSFVNRSCPIKMLISSNLWWRDAGLQVPTSESGLQYKPLTSNTCQSCLLGPVASRSPLRSLCSTGRIPSRLQCSEKPITILKIIPTALSHSSRLTLCKRESWCLSGIQATAKRWNKPQAQESRRKLCPRHAGGSLRCFSAF